MGGALIFVLISAAAGSLMAVQAPINAALGRSIGSPVAAALISFTLSAGATVLVLVGSGQVPNWREAPWWLYLVGGLLGVFIVLAGVILTPKLGAATFLACLIFGELAAGLVLDHLGAFGLEQHPITYGRIGAVALTLFGAVLLRFV